MYLEASSLYLVEIINLSMNKILLLLAIFILLQITGANSQNLIAVQNGNTVTLFSHLDSALNNANSGDTVYVPGGVWNIGTYQISKEIHIIGNGFHPDSTKPGLLSRIAGQFQFRIGATNSSFEGFELNGSFVFIANEIIENICISRVKFENLHLTATTKLSVKESIFITTYANNQPAEYCYFSNNIITGTITTNQYLPTRNCIYRNNVFIANYAFYPFCCGGYPLYTNNSILENNVFLNESGGGSILGSNNIVNNNLFIENWDLQSCGCLGGNNIIGQNLSNIFINQADHSFFFDRDYHLKITSPGKNAGTDGKDIGIYGGLFPWKDGSLPSNPQIKFKQISSTTDQNGNLQINMVVKAQNN